jgi:hypothetical protein
MKKERPIIFSTAMVQAILNGRKTVTRRIIKESFNGCLTNGGPHPCPNEPVIMYPGEEFDFDSGNGIERVKINFPEVRAIFHCSTLDAEAKCRQGKPGDLLWVRETWQKSYNAECSEAAGIGPIVGPYYIYKANHPEVNSGWKPSIHMLRTASRIRLEVISIKAERLQEITKDDAIKEGIHFDDDSGYWFAGDLAMAKTPLQCFRELWVSINGVDLWDCDPWVWRIEFKKL